MGDKTLTPLPREHRCAAIRKLARGYGTGRIPDNSRVSSSPTLPSARFATGLTLLLPEGQPELKPLANRPDYKKVDVEKKNDCFVSLEASQGGPA